MVGASKKPDIIIQALMADAYNYFDLVDGSWRNETEPTNMEKLYPIATPQPRRPRMDFYISKGLSQTRWQIWRRLHIAYGYRCLVQARKDVIEMRRKDAKGRDLTEDDLEEHIAKEYPEANLPWTFRAAYCPLETETAEMDAWTMNGEIGRAHV